MTRTARAAYPRAVIKDRSESRSGLDTSLRKSGAGQHNWGSIADERELETAAVQDELSEEEEIEAVNEEATESGTSPVEDKSKPERARSSSLSLTDNELEKARQFRKIALKKSGDIDLTAIARTSVAVSSSPPLADEGVVRRETKPRSASEGL